MKQPLMLIPPAQAEALYDAGMEEIPDQGFSLLPWLDEDSIEESPPTQTPPFPDRRSRTFSRQRAA